MATIELPSELRPLIDGAARVELEAEDVLELVDRLEARHPELGKRLRVGYAVVVDGTLHPSLGMVPLESNSEIRFIAFVAGG